jgi:AraC-like DNA-binding protein
MATNSKMNNFNKYLTPSSIDEEWGFFITTVGYSKIDTNQSYPISREHPETHSFTWNKGRILDDYYLVYISRGQGIFESSETGSIEVGTGTCFFLFPGVWHRYKPDPQSGWEEYWVGFRGYYPEHLMKQHFFDKKNPFIQVGLNEDLQRLFHKLLDSVRSSISGYHQIISGITLEMLGLINSISLKDDSGMDITGRSIAKAKFMMRESIENPIGIDQLLEDIPMSYSKFRQAFKKSTGLSPNQYYLNIRLNKAKELLSATSLNINEIAYHTGFESIFYFSKLFKKKNGISPKDYRNNS